MPMRQYSVASSIDVDRAALSWHERIGFDDFSLYFYSNIDDETHTYVLSCMCHRHGFVIIYEHATGWLISVNKDAELRWIIIIRASRFACYARSLHAR